MKIKISELREFLKRSAKIKSKGIIPVHDYLLVEFDRETVSITKSNGNAFCKHTIEEDNEGKGVFLVEEKRVSALVANAKGEHLTFATKGKQVIVTDATNKLTLQGEDPKTFPAFPEMDDAKRFELDPQTLAALFEARNFTSIIESNLHYVYCHERGGIHYIEATNQQVLYSKKFDRELPFLALSPETCGIVTSFDMVQYFSAGNYDFFDTSRTLYGFIKTEYQPVNFAPVYESIDRAQTLTLTKAPVVDFCALVSSLATYKSPIIRFVDPQSGDNVLSGLYDEPEYNVDVQRVFEIQKDFDTKGFNFNVPQLTEVLKCFATDEVILSPDPKHHAWCLRHPEEEGLEIIMVSYQINL